MTTESTQGAPALATALLATAPWLEVASRGLLLLVRPPVASWADPEADDDEADAPSDHVVAVAGPPAVWLILDGVEARALPPEFRGPIVREGVLRIPATETSGLELVVMTSEGVGRALDGVTRRSLEMRWLMRHSAPLHDPLHRHDSLVGAAGRLPADSLERAVRPLYVQAAVAFRALAELPVDAAPERLVMLMGEAMGGLLRLACVIEEGSHPTIEWLAQAGRATHLGKRIGSWLDDLGPATSGEARAARWVRDACSGVLRETAAVLQVEFGGRDWLVEPESYGLRPPR